jgi:alpha-glucosidase (family GH31 glycosyl hydrolase)
VIDFFHWTLQGDFRFEPRDWPDPDAMVKELHDMGVETVVSVWPTVDERSRNYPFMAEHGYLVASDHGCSLNSTWMGNTTYFDATHPDAQKFVWEQCKENYYQKASAASGWMKRNRNTEITILITTVITRARRCNAPTCTPSDMPRGSMRD